MARDLADETDLAGTESEIERKIDSGDGESAADYDENNANKGLLNRRNYLRLGAAAAATVAGTGAASGSVVAASDYGMNFDRTVDAVDDLGWDPTGSKPVTASLDENLRDGTLIELPPGEYLVDGMVSESDLTNWGIRGTGTDKGDARFVVPEGTAQRILNIRSNSRNILVENLTFDQYDTWETCIGNVLQVDDNLVVKDVEYAGKNPSEETGATSHLNLYVFDPDGSALLDGLVVKGATELIDYPNNVLTIFSGAESKGTINIRNCHFENCGEHAIYASRCDSAVRIENCYFKNNQNTHARISGEGSWVKNSTFVWDNDNHPNRGEFQAQTGMTFEAGYRGFTGGLVEGCTFVCNTSAPNSGCLKVDGSHGGITVRDCDFRIDADGAEPIWADAPGDSHMIDGEPAKPWDIQLDNVHVHGSALSTNGNTGAIELQGRDGSAVTNSCVQMTGDRDGVYYANMSGEVSDADIAVPGEAVALENADATTSNITNATCDVTITEDGSTSDGSTDDGSTDDGSTSDQPTYANDLTVFAEAGADAFEYEVTVDGKAALVTSGDYNATDASTNDGVGEKVVENDDGTVTILGIVADGGGDSFTYDGEIVDFHAGGPAKVVINGDVVDIGLLTDADTVRVFAKSGADAFTYEFDVAGAAELILDGENASTDASTNDGVGEKVVENDDGTVTVSGIVADGGGDSFKTSGEITAFRTDGSPVVYRNGERFDWQQLGLSRTLTIEGASTVSSYTATVSGDISPNPDLGTFDSGDNINGSTAEGAVMGGVDSYVFSGSITNFSLKGDATIYVDGEQVDPESLGLDHQLEVVGTGSPSNYGLTVSGELASNPDSNLSDEDVIDGSTATGSVSTEADKFLFSGDITAFELQGDAAVYLDGQQVSPTLLTSETDPVLANKLVVVGKGNKADYTFDVAGDVEKAPDLAGTESEDTITTDGDVETITGSAAKDTDGYRFSGNLTSMELDGSASITFADLDG